MENNESKNSKGLIIIIVVFSLIVLGLGGWMVYDKVINKDEPKPVEENNTKNNNGSGEKQEEADNDRIKIIEKYKKDLEGFPQRTEDVSLGDPIELLTVDEIKRNFVNLKRKKDGNVFTYNCREYSENNKLCYGIEIDINGELSLYSGYDLEWALDYDDIDMFIEDFMGESMNYIYQINNYYIVVDYGVTGQTGVSHYDIYNKSNKVYAAMTHCSITDCESDPIAFTNNKIHIVEAKCNDEECTNILKYTYNIIDLSKDEISVQKVKEFDYKE